MIFYEDLNKVNKPFEDDFLIAFRKFLDKGWYINGSELQQFELEFAEYNNTKHCIGVANGLDALTIALMALNLKVGSEVILPSNSYIATILAVMRLNLKPVLVEPDIETYNISAETIEKKITKKTKCIMPVHLYGKPCHVDSIVELAKTNNIYVIEDCAQAHGASFNGKPVGSQCDLGAFSFYPSKNLGCLGDGGAITCNDDQLANKIRALRNYGSPKKYVNTYLGVNSRLDELQAAFLRIKLKKLDAISNHKRELAKLYLDSLSDKLILPRENIDIHDVYHIFPVRCNSRDQLKTYLLDQGIKTEIHYPIPPYRQECLKSHFINEEYPVSDMIHETILSLPISASHTKMEIVKVIESTNGYFHHYYEV